MEPEEQNLEVGDRVEVIFYSSDPRFNGMVGIVEEVRYGRPSEDSILGSMAHVFFGVDEMKRRVVRSFHLDLFDKLRRLPKLETADIDIEAFDLTTSDGWKDFKVELESKGLLG